MLLEKKQNNATFAASHATHKIWNKYYATIWEPCLNFGRSVTTEEVTQKCSVKKPPASNFVKKETPA